jgi:hypothetical protein
MIAHSPLHKSGQTAFPHPALASGDDAKAPQRRGWQPVDKSPHPVPLDSAILAASRQSAMPEPADLESEEKQRWAVHGKAVVPDVPAENRSQPATCSGMGSDDRSRISESLRRRHMCMAGLYSTKVAAIGGRHGPIRSKDGLVDLELALPRALSGRGDATDPEQLFAGRNTARRLATESDSRKLPQFSVGPPADLQATQRERDRRRTMHDQIQAAHVLYVDLDQRAVRRADERLKCRLSNLKKRIDAGSSSRDLQRVRAIDSRDGVDRLVEISGAQGACVGVAIRRAGAPTRNDFFASDGQFRAKRQSLFGGALINLNLNQLRLGVNTGIMRSRTWMAT